MEDFLQALKSYFLSGGILMLPLGLLAFFLYYFAFDLLFYLTKISKIFSTQTGLFNALNGLNKIEKNADLKNIKSSFNYLRLQIMPRTSQALLMITVLASAAPLLGLLGTVTGMTLALSTLQADSSLVADGISRALITTQCGLTIAIPAMIIRMYCARIRQKILINLSKYESNLILGKAKNGA